MMMDPLGPGPGGALSISIPSDLGGLPPLSAQEVNALLSSYHHAPSHLPFVPEEQLTIPPALLDIQPPPEPIVEPPRGNPQLLALAAGLRGADYGSDVPFDPSKRAKWALQELEALAKRAEMDVYAESALPTSPVFESQRSSQSPFSPQGPLGPPMHTHNLLIGAGDFLIDMNVAWSSASPSPTLIKLLTSQPANPRLDVLLSRHLTLFFEMLQPATEEEDVDTVGVQRHLRTLERWLTELKAVENLVKMQQGDEKERKRWWTAIDEVAEEWEANMNRILDTSADHVPLDVLASVTPIPLPYLASPSASFLLSFSPSDYLTLLPLATPDLLSTTPSVTPSIDDLRDYLFPRTRTPSSTTPMAMLFLSHTPLPFNPTPSFHTLTSPSPFPTTNTHHFALEFTPPLWIRSSALANLPVTIPPDCMMGSSNDWLSTILGPRITPSPIYSWTSKLPNRAPKTFVVHFEYGPSGAEMDGAVQVSRLPVHSKEEVRAVLDVFAHEAWLANVLRGLEPTAESMLPAQAEDQIDVESLLSGQLPATPHIPISLQVTPLVPSEPSAPAPAVLRLTVLPHVSLSVYHPKSSPTPSPRVARLSHLKFPDDGEWEKKAGEVLRRGGLGFLIEWAWEKERERQASGAGHVEVSMPDEVPDLGVGVGDVPELDPDLLAQVLQEHEMGDVDVDVGMPTDIEQLGGGAGEEEGDNSTFDDLFGREGDGSTEGGLFGTEGGDEEMQDLEAA